MDGWRVRGARPHRPDRGAAATGPGRVAVPRLRPRSRGAGAPRDGRRAGVPRRAGRTGRRVPAHAVHRRRALRRSSAAGGYAGDARRPRLRLVAATRSGDPADVVVTGAARRRRSRRPSMRTSGGVRRAPIVGVMGGHAVLRGERRLPRRGACSAGSSAGAGMRRRHGWGTRGDGGGQPRRLPCRRRRTPTSTPRVDAARRRCRRSSRPIDAWAVAAIDVRERWPGGDGGLGVPTWFYGHEPTNLFAVRDRQAVPELGARGDAARPVRRGSRVPARRRRHGAGGLPGRLRELLRRRPPASPRWCSSAPPLDRDGPGVAAAERRWPPTSGFGPRSHLVDDVDAAARLVAERLRDAGTAATGPDDLDRDEHTSGGEPASPRRSASTSAARA